VAKKISLIFKAWRQTDKKFKAIALIFFVVATVDVAVAAMWRGDVGALLRLDVLAVLVAGALFYVFFTPLTMHILYKEALRKLKRGRDVNAVLADAMFYSTLWFVLLYAYYVGAVKLAMP